MGLYDLRNRFYSPDLGRFLQPDPIGFKGDGSNLYRYCGNDWANRTDPMGLQTNHQMSSFSLQNYNMFWEDVRRLAALAFNQPAGNVTTALNNAISPENEGPKGDKSKGAQFKDYGNWVDAGVAGAKQAINKGGRTREWGGEIFATKEDGSGGVFITRPHPGTGVGSVSGRGSVQRFEPDPRRVPEGYKMIGFYWSHTRPAQDIPLYDRQVAYAKGWHAVLAAQPDPGFSKQTPHIMTYEYVRGNPPH